MIDKLKSNLASVAALIAAVAAIGGGFVKYGEIVTKLDALESASGGTDWSAQIAVLEEKVGALENADTSHSHDTSHEHDDTNIKIVQKEIDIIKLDITELKERSKNPLAN